MVRLGCLQHFQGAGRQVLPAPHSRSYKRPNFSLAEAGQRSAIACNRTRIWPKRVAEMGSGAGYLNSIYLGAETMSKQEWGASLLSLPGQSWHEEGN